MVFLNFSCRLLVHAGFEEIMLLCVTLNELAAECSLERSSSFIIELPMNMSCS